MIQRFGIGQELFNIAVLTYLKRVGVLHLLECIDWIHAFLTQACQFVTRVLYLPQTVIQTYLGLDGVGCADPVDGSLALAVAV